jgi:ABC-type multidrug transport system fused ATPase/permease subunit
LNIYRAVINIVINLGFIGYITVLNPLLGLIFAAGLVVLIFLEYFRVSAMLKNMKKTKRAIERVKSNEAEILKGIKEIKGLGAREAIIDKHSGVSTAFADVKYKREMFNTKMQSGINLVKAAIDLAILLFAGLYLLKYQQWQLPAVLVVYNYRGNIYGLIAGLARIKDTYVNGELAAKRINDIIIAPGTETDSFGETDAGGDIGRIEFRDVGFGYTPEKQILKDVDFTIEGNGVVGFVGKSGSGKSTIFSLIAGFYRPTAGKVFINDTDMTALSEQFIRSQITPILQDPYIFNDTVMNNLRFARVGATDEEVFDAARTARIHDEIMEMRDGYKTIIGENGATISGGQKQRLEIARAILKNTKVMLFDEATSALDKTNLEKINDLMIELGKSKIVLVIAHRLGVMRRCDRVVVLDEGRVIATGNHDELMKTSDYYMELFKKASTAESKAV